MAEPASLNADFRPSYRPERVRVPEADSRRMGLIAAGFGGTLALILGGTMLMHGGHRTIPVIDPESGPVRVKPADPGGMQVSGADLTSGTAEGGPHLAPAAERPEIAALRAEVRTMQKQLARQAAETAALAKQHSEAGSPVKLAAAETPRIAAAAPVEKATVTARVPLVAETAEKPIGNAVQLAAFADAKAAEAEWQALLKRNPELLGGRTPEISKVDAAGHVMYRLRTGGFETVAAATAFCAKMRAKSESCSIAAF